MPNRRLVFSFLAGTAVVIAAVAVVYHEAALSYFVDDDFHWLQGPRRFEWSGLLDLDRYDHFYRPMIEVYFAIGQWAVGCSALPFHLASIGIHLLNTLVLFAFARRLTGDIRFASMTVLLFAVQPGFVEAVAWVAAITDLLPALWYLLTLLLHLMFVQDRRSWTYGASMATFTACLLTHESAATLLPMMIVLEGLLALEGRLPGQDRLSRARPDTCRSRCCSVPFSSWRMSSTAGATWYARVTTRSEPTP